jgi:hypothetical protein
MRMVVMLAFVIGCGGRGSSDKGFCERAGKLCDAELTAKEVAECDKEMPELKKLLGDEPYDKFITCGNEATSCMELIGCTGGAFAKLGEDAVNDFERGFGRMMSKSRRGIRRGDEEGPLPPECKRADEVCAADEPFARDKCVRMVGNLKADAENRKKLVSCYEASKNCFEFKKCTTDLWFELN